MSGDDLDWAPHMEHVTTIEQLNGRHFPNMSVFYAPWCGHCQHAQHPIEQLSQRVHAKGGHLYVVNADALNPHLRSNEVATSVPSFRQYSAPGEFQPLRMEQAMNYDTLTAGEAFETVSLSGGATDGLTAGAHKRGRSPRSRSRSASRSRSRSASRSKKHQAKRRRIAGGCDDDDSADYDAAPTVEEDEVDLEGGGGKGKGKGAKGKKKASPKHKASPKKKAAAKKASPKHKAAAKKADEGPHLMNGYASPKKSPKSKRGRSLSSRLERCEEVVHEGALATKKGKAAKGKTPKADKPPRKASAYQLALKAAWKNAAFVKKYEAYKNALPADAPKEDKLVRIGKGALGIELKALVEKIAADLKRKGSK